MRLPANWCSRDGSNACESQRRKFSFTAGLGLSTVTLYLSTMGNLKKKRRLKMNKHKRRKRLKSNRHKKRTWQK
jgi:hypothetical protein